jgi:outer membrane protein TolC
LGLSLIPDEFDLALSDSRSKSPSLLLAVYALEKAQAELDFAKVIIRPRLSLNYSIERGTFGDTSANTSSVLLN